MSKTFKAGDIIHDKDEDGLFGTDYGIVTEQEDNGKVWAMWFDKKTLYKSWDTPLYTAVENCELYTGPAHLSPESNNEVQDAIDTLCKHGYTVSLSLTNKD
jgi:hypothetical protein